MPILLEKKTLGHFIGGLNTKYSPGEALPNEARNILNCSFGVQGSLVTRPGTVKLLNVQAGHGTDSAWRTFRGLHHLKRGASDTLYLVNGNATTTNSHEFKRISNASPTAVDLCTGDFNALSATAMWRLLTITQSSYDLVIGVNGTDYPRKIYGANAPSPAAQHEVRRLGIPAPAAPTTSLVAGGSLVSGRTYEYRITWVNPIGTESNTSTIVTATPSGANLTVRITRPALDAQTNVWRVYRRDATAGESVFRRISGDIASATSTFDDNGSATLGAQAPDDNTNNVAPIMEDVVEFQGRLVGYNGSSLYWSKVNGREQWPTANEKIFNQPLTGIAVAQGQIVLYYDRGDHLVSYTGNATNPFRFIEDVGKGVGSIVRTAITGTETESISFSPDVGFFSVSGRGPILISEKIESTVLGTDRFGVAGFRQNRLNLMYGLTLTRRSWHVFAIADTDQNGATAQNNKLYVYDYRLAGKLAAEGTRAYSPGAWTRFRFAIDIALLAVRINSNTEEELLLGGYDGFIYRFGVSQGDSNSATTSTTAGDQAYTKTYTPAWTPLVAPGMQGRLREIYAHAKASGAWAVNLDTVFDYTDLADAGRISTSFEVRAGFTLGTGNNVLGTDVLGTRDGVRARMLVDQGRMTKQTGEYISTRIQNTTINQDFEVFSLEYFYQPLPARLPILNVA